MKKENKDFNMIAYANIDQFIEIDLKDGSAVRPIFEIAPTMYSSRGTFFNKYEYLEEFETEFSYDNFISLKFTLKYIDNIIRNMRTGDDEVDLNSYFIVEDISNYLDHMTTVSEYSIIKDKDTIVLHDSHYEFNEKSNITSMMIYITGRVEEENVKIVFKIKFNRAVFNLDKYTLDIIIKMMDEDDINNILEIEEIKLAKIKKKYNNALYKYKNMKLKYNVRTKLTVNADNKSNIIKFKRRNKETGN